MRRYPSQSGWLLVLLLLGCFVNAAYGLDPNRMMSQYAREQWSIEGGASGGIVRAIAQTADGYLWIGTDGGLVRFDGSNFRAAPFSSTGLFSNAGVLGLTKDSDGNLLVRLQGAGILRQSKGQFENVASDPGPTASYVTAMWSETNGGVLLSDLMGGMLRYRGGRLEVLARRDSLPWFSLVVSLAETSDGKIWMGTLGTGLFYLAQGAMKSISEGMPYKKINCLLPAGSNELWVGTDHGLFRWNGTTMSRVGLSPLPDNVQVLTLLQDRDSNVWVGTARGLLRINDKGNSFLSERELRGDGGINTLFEDREGDIWVGGARGVERIRDSAFVTYSPVSGFPSDQTGAIYPSAENGILFAPTKGGLYRFKSGRAEPLKEAGLGKDVIYSITGQNNDIWVGRRTGGLTHLRLESGHLTSRTYTEADGLAQNSVFAAYESRDGAVWAGTLNQGASRFKDGRFVTYTIANGLSSNTVNSILEARDGTTWIATPNGLSAFSAGQWKTYSQRDGLHSDNVNCLFEDSSGVLWVGTSDGLVYMRPEHVGIFHAGPDVLPKQILGMAEDKHGWLWIAAANHVSRVRRDKLMGGELAEGDVREYGPVDGLQSTEGVGRSRSVVADSVGRIWFSTAHGLSVVDPSHLVGDGLAAVVHVDGISSDGNSIDLGDSIQAPSPHKRITFRYTGVSLAVPERIRFRYILDNFDRNWSEPTAAREAVYTNLTPGAYRFRVIASNSDGTWNGSETDISLVVAPAYWQTWWFRLACVLIIGLATLTFFRLRMLNLTKQMNIRMEERVNERTRIARELHDSLLQGFQGLMFRLQAVQDLLPDRPIDAMRALETALNRGDDVIAEGRGTVEDLRNSKVIHNDLVQALSALREELGPDERSVSPTTFRVFVEGQPCGLDPMFRDEAYSIAREALRNAFRHSQAQKIEAEITYGESHFVLRIRDDGNGIDPKYLDNGERAGHWGLPGMRERAKRLGGQLEVWSEQRAGTEVELTVPASIAYVTSLVRSRFWFLRKLKGIGNNGNQS